MAEPKNGRIGGGVLADNLLRNGVDLAFETELLYLKVGTPRVGINNPSPSVELDVNNSIRTTNLVTDKVDVATFTIQNSEINSTNTIYVNAANNILASSIATDDIKIDVNTIRSRTTDANIELRPNGTGTIEIHANTNITGSLHATGNITFGGSLTLGNDNTDNVEFASDVNSDIIPDTTDTSSLGSPSKRWKDVYSNLLNGQRIEVGAFTVSDTSLARRQGNMFYVSTLGSDTNVGDHQHGAFRTIEHALAVADSSTAGPVTIFIYPGEYEENLPLIVPENTTITGEDIRNVIVKPAAGSESLDVFHLNQNTLVENVTVKDFLYDSINDTGYAFRFAAGAVIAERSPYVRNVSVLTQETSTGAGDAGRGALIDGSVLDSNTTSPSMLFHSATFITPNADCITMTNGVRVEWLNSFTYFANRGLYATQGTAGFGGEASTASVTTGGSPGEVWAAPRTLTVSGTLNGKNSYSYGDERIEWTGSLWKYYNTTIGSSSYYQSLEDTSYPWEATTWTSVGLALPAPTFTAEGVSFGAEVRSIGSANVYGNYAAVADGADTLMYLIGHNFAYIGAGLDYSNDRTLTLQDQEAVELNSGRIYYTSTDADGTFRVGNAFYVDFDRGTTSIDASSIDFSGVSAFFIRTGPNITYIDGERIDTGNIRFSGNTIETLDGDLIWSPATGVFDVSTNNTGFIIPRGTTAQRTNEESDLRYNTTTNLFEGFSSANVGFGGVFSDNRLTKVTRGPLASDIIFTANNTQVGKIISGGVQFTGLATTDILIQNNQITTTLSNSNLELSPDGTGIVQIDSLNLFDNIIENTSNNNLSLSNTGRGYVKFDSTTGLIVPSGTDADRPLTPPTGLTRWNTERDYMETWNGTAWIRSSGEGETVTAEIMGDILDIYTLVLG